MRKVVLVSILSLTLISCFLMPPSALKTHLYKNINNSNLQVSVLSTQGRKTFIIEGLQKNDSLNMSISSTDKTFYSEKTLTKDSIKAFYIRISDYKFYRIVFNDTLKIKIIKPNSDFKIHKFLKVPEQ